MTTTTTKRRLSPTVKFLLLLGAGIGVTIVTGVVCGRVSQRWGPRPDMVAAGEHLKSLPAQLGNWQLVRENVMPPVVVQTLACAGYVSRTYVNRNSGEEVSLAIVVGPSGPISVHTPEICYSSQDYGPEELRRRIAFAESGDGRDALWCTKFRSNNTIAEQLVVYYGWCTDENWAATESPRFSFAGRPLLFKLQIASQIPPGELAEGEDPCHAFLKELFDSGWKVHG